MQQQTEGLFSASGGFLPLGAFQFGFVSVSWICLFLPRHRGTALWVGSSLPSSEQQRPGATRHNNISRFITPASWFMSEKQDTLGCCYFIGTHTWNHTSAWPRHRGICIYFCVYARVIHAPLRTHTHTLACTYTQTVSLIRPGSCCCVRGNYSMQLSEALMESFRLTGSTVRSLDSVSFLTRSLYGSFCSLFSLKRSSFTASWKDFMSLFLFFSFLNIGKQTYKKRA